MSLLGEGRLQSRRKESERELVHSELFGLGIRGDEDAAQSVPQYRVRELGQLIQREVVDVNEVGFYLG
jgi:hypothetical protein